MNLKYNLIDLSSSSIYPAEIKVSQGKIKSIKKIGERENSEMQYILPGFIDSHIHIESSMLIPSEFARLSVVHGTVATVSDPHEIANVLGITGIRFMIENGKKVPFKFYFGASSCVPATNFETAGAEITSDDIKNLFEEDKLKYLSEMMNYPGVLFNDPSVMTKIGIAREFGKPIDGHAPGLRGEDAKKYISAGITTDHECYELDEAREKIKYGMKILIREGSAAKNFEALHPLIKEHPDMVMFCSDDKHPNDLVINQIDDLVRRALSYGYNLFDVLSCASVNSVKHYNLEVGLLRENDPADFIVINNIKEFKILKTYIDGKLVAEKGKTHIKSVDSELINNFNRDSLNSLDMGIPYRINDEDLKTDEKAQIRIIEALDGQLITNEIIDELLPINGRLYSEPERDILKITVIDRYNNSKQSLAFIKNFGLKKGAIASSVAHDSHNIIAVGVNDTDIVHAINAVIEKRGGISVSVGNETEVLQLPIAGIMTNEDGYKTAEKYTKIDSMAKKLGSKLNAPFMTLSFMALLVIPKLKLSDKGLFNGEKFNFTELFV